MKKFFRPSVMFSTVDLGYFRIKLWCVLLVMGGVQEVFSFVDWLRVSVCVCMTSVCGVGKYSNTRFFLSLPLLNLFHSQQYNVCWLHQYI